MSEPSFSPTYDEPSRELETTVLECQQYERHTPRYGPLRVVLYDGAVEDLHVSLCLATARHQHDSEGARIAETLLDYTLDERQWIFEKLHSL